jgi:hypothetical protein
MNEKEMTEDTIAYVNNDGYINVGTTYAGFSGQLKYQLPQAKSYLEVGGVTFSNDRRFNWLERFMWKYLLGVKIRNVE